MAGETQNASAYDHYLKGRQHFKAFTREENEAAKAEFLEAVRLDPKFARAYGWLGYAHFADVQEGWAGDPEKSIELALRYAKQGVELKGDDYYAHWNLASIYAGQNDVVNASPAYNRAIELNPEDADLLVDRADMHSYQGEPEEAIRKIKRAMELKIPQWYYWSLGFAYFQARRYAEAAAALEMMSDPPNTAYLLLVASRAKTGNKTDPGEIMAHLRRKDSEWAPDYLGRFPFANPADRKHYLDTFADAGIPVP